MTEVAQTEPTPEIVEEAALWVIQLNSPDVTDADRDACERWCRESPAHRLAMDRMRGLDARLGASGPVEIHALQSVWSNRRRKRRWIGGASILLLFGIASATLPSIMERQRRANPAYNTVIGEQRTFRLSDGSLLTLDTNSAASVSMQEGARIVTLHRGQILATVAHASTPFVIKTPYGSATALGTAYTVGLDGSGATVAVARSRVRACDTGATGAIRCLTLDPGQRARLDARGANALADVDSDLARAWADGWLAVDDRPVAEVLVALNRYRPVPVQFSPRRIADIRVSGSFPLGDTDRALEAVADASGLRLSRAADGTMIIDRK